MKGTFIAFVVFTLLAFAAAVIGGATKGVKDKVSNIAWICAITFEVVAIILAFVLEFNLPQ